MQIKPMQPMITVVVLLTNNFRRNMPSHIKKEINLISNEGKVTRVLASRATTIGLELSRC